MSLCIIEISTVYPKRVITPPPNFVTYGVYIEWGIGIKSKGLMHVLKQVGPSLEIAKETETESVIARETD